MGKLSYSKWDALQLSDDSDIETHPNVSVRLAELDFDKAECVPRLNRWKQRDIHEKREMRKLKLHHLALEKKMNASLLERMRALLRSLESEDSGFLEREASRLRALVPDFETKQLAPGEQPSEDHMVLSLVLQIRKAVVDGADKGKGEVGELREHIRRLEERQVQVDKETEEEEREQKRYITSDDVHVGWDSKTMVSKTLSAASTKPAEPKKTKKATETVVETLNSPSTSSTSSSTAMPPQPTPDPGDSDDDDPPPLTPNARQFADLPANNFEMAYKFISAHPDLLDPKLVDALLVEAFERAMRGDDASARACVEKSLMLQYCHQLGRDGVSLFFKRMASGKKEALDLFLNDVKSTADRLVNRAHVVAQEKKAEGDGEGVEQIQLVPTQEGMSINFEVPDGPPPEKFEITGEGADTLDPEQVRAYLQHQWDVFTAFPEPLREALKSKSLERVNAVLGKMSVPEAEAVVHQLQDGNILSFDGDDIRDETGKGPTSDGRLAQPSTAATSREEGVQALADELD